MIFFLSVLASVLVRVLYRNQTNRMNVYILILILKMSIYYMHNVTNGDLLEWLTQDLGSLAFVVHA